MDSKRINRPAERSDLDRILSGGCGNPDCDCDDRTVHPRLMFFHPKCHPRRLAAYYDNGLIFFECDECEKPVGVFRVHDDLQPPVEAFQEIAARATRKDLREIKAEIERRLWEVLDGKASSGD